MPPGLDEGTLADIPANKTIMLVRPVNPLEAGPLTQIALAAKRHWGYPERWMEIWTPQLTFDATYFETNESWAAVLDDKPIGFYTLLDHNGTGWIDNLWVVPEYIGQGVGKSLFVHALAMARQRGYKILQLEADPNTVGFYEKMGMYRIGERQSEVDGMPRSMPILEMKS
jgi:ribosomal protein S18 acetylase RimI-like enzyme